MDWFLHITWAVSAVQHSTFWKTVRVLKTQRKCDRYKKDHQSQGTEEISWNSQHFWTSKSMCLDNNIPLYFIFNNRLIGYSPQQPIPMLKLQNQVLRDRTNNTGFGIHLCTLLNHSLTYVSFSMCMCLLIFSILLNSLGLLAHLSCCPSPFLAFFF